MLPLLDVCLGLARVAASTVVSAIFASEGWFGGPRRAVISGRDIRDLMLGHLCAIVGIGGAMCVLAAAAAVVVRVLV